ncbi:hypothetical protein [Candidatus Nitrotoga sp. AM1P]|uniref:hypothetical protein n=1 Tax=Candidatus Nitrotoga sp. AM1P TaxID=2559597 RepID=UPI0015675B0B|nr:hypothetical protein [Candidatus Nitrotoga sp. AM1P]
MKPNISLINITLIIYSIYNFLTHNLPLSDATLTLGLVADAIIFLPGAARTRP